MESIQPRYETLSTTESFSNKNLIIVVLVGLLVLSFVGINVLDIASNLIKTVISIFGPIFAQLLSVIGYTTGTVINKAADVVTDTTKTGLDIAGGTIHDVGNLMISASNGHVNDTSKKNLDKAINNSKHKASRTDPEPDTTASPIQQPSKGGWCLVGDFKNSRGCVEVADASKCMSHQVFPTQKMCLNPTQTTQN